MTQLLIQDFELWNYFAVFHLLLLCLFMRDKDPSRDFRTPNDSSYFIPVTQIYNGTN